MRLRSDLAELMLATIEGRLQQVTPVWDECASACVVLAAKGYPGAVVAGDPIRGLEDAPAEGDRVVFHAGTALRNGRIVTAGGRVLGVTALGPTIRDAVQRAYEVAKGITWEGMHYRKDIGHRAMKNSA
ncbi:MAG: hypothetical protein HY543_04575 [Deltaproteobacteria bacterium]|nr:hypothetical protein [Deltaproteobacteria bacterium]